VFQIPFAFWQEKRPPLAEQPRSGESAVAVSASSALGLQMTIWALGLRDAVRNCSGEVAIKQVRRDRWVVATIGRAHSGWAMMARRPCLHISRSTRLRHAAALSLWHGMDPRATIASTAVPVVRVFLPRSSVSSTGHSGQILIRWSTRRSAIWRVTDFNSHPAWHSAAVRRPTVQTVPSKG
jgi:hypothetical protein